MQTVTLMFIFGCLTHATDCGIGVHPNINIVIRDTDSIAIWTTLELAMIAWLAWMNGPFGIEFESMNGTTTPDNVPFINDMSR